MLTRHRKRRGRCVRTNRQYAHSPGGDDVLAIANADSILKSIKLACNRYHSAREPLEKQRRRLDSLSLAIGGYRAIASRDMRALRRAVAYGDSAKPYREKLDSLELELTVGVDSAFAFSPKVWKTRTDINAHYVLDSLPVGPVLLMASDYRDGRSYRWLARAEIRPGKRTRADLSEAHWGDLVCYNTAVTNAFTVPAQSRTQP